jgi:hypothetical protein
MAANVARLRQDMDQARRVVEGATSNMRKAADTAMTALKGLGTAAGAVGFVRFISNTAQANKELERFSYLANTSINDFQKIALASSRFGVSQEKLADILKDTQDKVGDFIQTGGGAMADFFERVAPKVGVTADQFRKLNGKDALQLYVSSLEKANLSQADMVFYMEAIASDSTLLLPLLKDNGKAFEELATQADAFGLSMDEGAIRASGELSSNLSDLNDFSRGFGQTIYRELLPAMVAITTALVDWAKSSGLAQIAGNVVKVVFQTIAVVGSDVVFVISQIGRGLAALAQATGKVLTGDFSGAANVFTEYNAQARVARAALDDMQAKIMGVGQAGVETAKVVSTTTTRLSEAFTKPTKAATEAAKELAEQRKKDLAIGEMLNKQVEERAKKELALLNKVNEEYFQNQAATEAAQQATIKSATELIDEIERETQALTMTNAEREVAIKLRALEAAGLKEGSAEYEIYAQKIREAISGKAAIEESINQQKKAEADWSKTWDQVSQSFSDALMQGGRSVKEYLIGLFRTMVLRPVIMGTIGGISGMGASGASAGGLEGMIGSAVNSGIGSLLGGITLGGSSLAAIGSSIGTGFMTTITGGSVAAASGAYTAAGMTGVAGGLSAGATAAMAVPYVAAAVAALSALGVFRSNKIVGSGVTGTLGEGLQEFDVNRRGGSLFSGPKYSNVNFRETEQSQAINNAFLAMRSSTSEMAKQLGLATDKVDVFTSKLEIDFSKLTDEQRMAKINEALQLSGNAMAELVLGAGATAQQLAQLYATVMQERAGLENQLLQLQGNTVEIRKRERDAIHESNRAIYDQIRALEDQQAANQAAAQIAQERYGLETQLLQAQGDTAALRARERELISEENRDLFDKIKGIEDQRVAQEKADRAREDALRIQQEAERTQQAAAEETRRAMEEATRAEQARIDAIRNSTKTLIDEINRLRGIGDTASGKAALQAQFAILTAQARAGDTEAISKLPTISKALEDATRMTATSARDVAFIRAVLANNLSDTVTTLGGTVPAFANGGMHSGGIRLVGERGPELEATGPARYYSASQTQSMMGGGVVDEIKGLREEVSMLRAEARATAVNTGRTQDIMKRVTRNGEYMIVATDGEPLEVTP